MIIFIKREWLNIIIALFLIIAGITTKYYNGTGEEFIHNHLGGAIYVIFWILFFSIIFPKYSHFKLTIWVFSITCLIEFTQLIHTPILENAREFFIFRTLFGSTFNPYDFIWYLIGAILGYYLLVITSKIKLNAL
jgi:hypothetical protein